MDKVTHFEIPAGDVGRTRIFYSSIFGWKTEEYPVNGETYTMVTTVPVDDEYMPKESGAINGGITRASGDVKNPVVTISVSSIDEYLEKISSLGGRTVRPKSEVKGMGYYAYFADPDNNVMGLWEDLK